MANPVEITEVNLQDSIRRHIQFTLGGDPDLADRRHVYLGLAHAVRDRLVARWLQTQRSCYDLLVKRVYYLSMEFLPGRFLRNYLCNLGLEKEAEATVRALGYDLENLEEEEWDAGLGNGGLGRLASCFLDSMATLRLPAYGYGIRYDYGIFLQTIVDGYQREEADNWMREGTPWEIQRPDVVYAVCFRGRTETYTEGGRTRHRWTDTDSVLAMASDLLIPGFGSDYVTNMRLWVAKASQEFELRDFNLGDYTRAVEKKVLSENISKVLYPSDEIESGRALRLTQQYFFVSATLQDIIRRFKKQHREWKAFPDFVAIQLNDTHPTIAIPELMRVLMDLEGLGWDQAWDVSTRTFGYTNHTVLPEALETWPVELFGWLLPRHLEIIYEMNRRFLGEVRQAREDEGLAARVSLFQEGTSRRIRMAHLAVVGSHSVNGVAELHSSILKQQLFPDFDHLFPDRLRNVTNGITPRRWLYQSNPDLSRLISEAIGSGWITRLEELRKLAPLAEDSAFRTQWQSAKRKNKQRLARYVLRKVGLGINPETLFDIQVKRIHEYKRQLLNALHVVTLYNRIRHGTFGSSPARTVVFAGKAAPAYRQAKLIIKLIHSIADRVNNDPLVEGRLRVVFLPNYCVSQAEKVIPGADLSEQISTAGMEASGTGNMKFALNGALTIGTLDGANVEILREVGRENFFLFGMTAEEVAAKRLGGYDPRRIYENDAEFRGALDAIASGLFSENEPDLFRPILQSILDWGDYFMVAADFQSYLTAQEEVGRTFQDVEGWARRSILNTAFTGRFSSDRSILEYSREIWGISPLE